MAGADDAGRRLLAPGRRLQHFVHCLRDAEAQADAPRQRIEFALVGDRRRQTDPQCEHDIGGFDDHFFLYCEDTDLGLRARWAGWKCLYVPQAVVEHHYSHSAGRASPLKAYLVERNRLFVLIKNFPVRTWPAALFVSADRYLWHLWYILKGQGSAARFRAEGHAGPKMVWYVLRAHLALLGNLPRLWKQRREIRARARVTPAVFLRLLRSHSISAQRMAAL